MDVCVLLGVGLLNGWSVLLPFANFELSLSDSGLGLVALSRVMLDIGLEVLVVVHL